MRLLCLVFSTEQDRNWWQLSDQDRHFYAYRWKVDDERRERFCETYGESNLKAAYDQLREYDKVVQERSWQYEKRALQNEEKARWERLSQSQREVIARRFGRLVSEAENSTSREEKNDILKILAPIWLSYGYDNVEAEYEKLKRSGRP